MVASNKMTDSEPKAKPKTKGTFFGFTCHVPLEKWTHDHILELHEAMKSFLFVGVAEYQAGLEKGSENTPHFQGCFKLIQQWDFRRNTLEIPGYEKFWCQAINKPHYIHLKTTYNVKEDPDAITVRADLAELAATCTEEQWVQHCFSSGVNALYCEKFWELAQRKKFTPFPLPPMDVIELRPLQQWLLDQLQAPPEPRRIYWMNWDVGAGKSTIFRYLEDKYPHGVCTMETTGSLDNCIRKYYGEGVAVWHFPKAVEFNDGHAACWEAFSDVGIPLRSKKYKGHKVRANCHVVVFANQYYPDTIAHKDVIRAPVIF